MKKKRCINDRFDDSVTNRQWQVTTRTVYGISVELFQNEENEWIVEHGLYEKQQDLRKNTRAKISQ